MSKRTKLIGGGAAVLVVAATGAGFAIAGGEDDSAEQVRGAGADRATEAALEITDGGTANSVELDSENGATWEVEVTKDDGETVDVRLDENYDDVIVESDTEAEDESE